MSNTKESLTPVQAEEKYGIKFSEYERRLLDGPRGMLMSPIDQQKDWVLRHALLPRQCPACLGTICERSALGNPMYGEGAVEYTDRDYKCPLCDTKLTHWVGLIAGQEGFDITPGQVVEIGKGLVKP